MRPLALALADAAALFDRALPWFALALCCLSAAILAAGLLLEGRPDA